MIILSLVVHKTIVSRFIINRWFEKWLLLGFDMPGVDLQERCFLFWLCLAQRSLMFWRNRTGGINSEKDVVITPQTLSGGVFKR